MVSLGRTPPPGLLEIAFALAPVSQQASGAAKQAFRTAVQLLTRSAGFLFSGDVQLTVEWLVSEQRRYETDRTPDVDNILKPLIDALVGPDGLLIDDNQIQSVVCSWVDWNHDDERISVEIRYLEDEWLPKDAVLFVQFEGGLCLPIPRTAPKTFQTQLLDLYVRALDIRTKAKALGIDDSVARTVMPAQRIFHRTRLHSFPVLTADEFRAQLSDIDESRGKEGIKHGD